MAHRTREFLVGDRGRWRHRRAGDTRPMGKEQVMLSAADNELITQVGPGTPGGEMMRQYWMPLLESSDLPGPDTGPIRVRLLGEDLVAFRDSNAKVGLLAERCAHRGASLFFGRNEE